MLTIETGGKTVKTSNMEHFNTLYFALLRIGEDAVGFDGATEVFRISKGIEYNRERMRLFASKPDDWKRPTHEELVGALNQFRNISQLCRVMGISRTAVQLWKKKQKTAPISFLSWRYLCEYMGVHVAVSHNLEYNEIARG